jgi:hypothetical protein
MPLPVRVAPKNQARKATTTAETPSTHSDCGRMVAPASEIGLSPEKCGSAWLPFPSVTSTRPRRIIDTPMVMMMMLTTSALRAGAMARRSTMRPIRPTISTPIRIASGRGRPAVVRNTAAMPPSMMNSPCAKLMTPEAL